MSEEFISLRIPIWIYKVLEENSMERRLGVAEYIYELAKDDMYHSKILKGIDKRVRTLERKLEDESDKGQSGEERGDCTAGG